MSDVDQGPSDDELFNEAVSDETPDAPVVAEQVEQPVRDEAGRFAKKDEPETAEVVAETQTEKPAVDDNASQVPSWRVREINEEKRAALAELETLRAALARTQWQQPAQQPSRRLQPQPEKVVKPDPLIDPDGYESVTWNGSSRKGRLPVIASPVFSRRRRPTRKSSTRPMRLHSRKLTRLSGTDAAVA
jgi:hypothetical protein